MSGSSVASSARANGQKASSPEHAAPPRASRDPGPCSRTRISPAITTPIASVTSQKPAHVEPTGRHRRRARDPEPDDDEAQRHRDRRHHQQHRHRGGLDEGAAGERAGDHAELEGRDQERGRPSGQPCLLAGPRRAPVDDRHLERQPHDVEALDRPRDEEGRERRRERHGPRRERGHRGREQQHLPVPDEVAEPREQRHHERGDDQLGGLEPVHVGVVDGQVVGDVAEDRRVVALQDPARDLHADQEADDRGEPGDARSGRGRCRCVGHAGSLSIRRVYQRMPSRKSSTPMCSS